jgi:multidrug efflux system outer membrane protein
MKAVAWGLTLMCAVLTGCTSMRPAFVAPEIDTPSAFLRDAASLPENERGSWKPAEPAEGQTRGEWWRAFDDPVLDSLMDEALRDSPALMAAAARVRQSRALLGITDSERGVQLAAGGGPVAVRASPGSLGLPPDANPGSRTLWRAPLLAAYEVDLFGRLKDASAAARADLEATEATRRSVTLALQADLARTYFELREADAELQILREALRLRQANLGLLERRREAGAVGELDVTQARAEVAGTRAQAQAAEGRRIRLENAIAVLSGRPPARRLVSPDARASKVPAIPPGLPSALLERRPDVVAAQRGLLAANARIGVARAAFFPSVRLTGTAGFESDALGDLFRWSSRTWFLGPFIGGIVSVPLLDGGRNKAALERARAEYEEAVAQYRQRVLVAFGDVEDALGGLRSLELQAESVTELVGAAVRAAQLARIRHEAGAVSYLEVLEAQRSALEAQREANRVQAARAQATVALVRALGGGWDTPSVASGPRGR